MAGERTLTEIQNAIRAHGAWKMRLKMAIQSGRSDISPSDVCKDDLCDFGRWLHDDTMPDFLRNGMPYKVVRRLHAEFHDIAGQVMTAAVTGDTAQARLLFDGPYAEKSEKLISALNKWKRELREA